MASSPPPKITIRDGTAADGAFILSAFDSAISYLPTIGSADQWGPQLFSQRGAGSMEPMTAVVRSSPHHAAHQATPGHEGELYDLSRVDLVHARCLIADSSSAYPGDDSTPDVIPVAALCFQDFIPPHLVGNNADFAARAEEMRARDSGRFIYVWALVSDFGADPARRKGAGAALLGEVKDIAKRCSVPWIYLDCWKGNDRKLVRYYERNGFKAVQDFSFTRPSGEIWPGTLLEIEVAKL